MASDGPPEDAEQQQTKPGDKKRKTRNDNQGGASAEVAALIHAVSDEYRADRNEARRRENEDVSHWFSGHFLWRLHHNTVHI